MHCARWCEWYEVLFEKFIRKYKSECKKQTSFLGHWKIPLRSSGVWWRVCVESRWHWTSNYSYRHSYTHRTAHKHTYLVIEINDLNDKCDANDFIEWMQRKHKTPHRSSKRMRLWLTNDKIRLDIKWWEWKMNACSFNHCVRIWVWKTTANRNGMRSGCKGQWSEIPNKRNSGPARGRESFGSMATMRVADTT